VLWRKPVERGESQCVEKKFCMSRSPPEGGRQTQKSKIEKPKIAKSQKSKIGIFRFRRKR
jgi:hypothetical protein